MSSRKNGLKLLDRLLPSGGSQAENGKTLHRGYLDSIPCPWQPATRERKTLRVLTLTPFYPFANDDVFGMFCCRAVACPLEPWHRQFCRAVQPFYRAQLQAAHDSFPSEWLRYLSCPAALAFPLPVPPYLRALSEGASSAADDWHRSDPRTRAFALWTCGDASKCGTGITVRSHSPWTDASPRSKSRDGLENGVVGSRSVSTDHRRE